MDEKDLLQQIQTLVDREHELRTESQSGHIRQAEQQAQLKQLEEALDQCWDLLRQRRARHEFGQDPDVSVARPVDEVEKYLQ
jgi:hypothetical protein